MLRSTLGLSFVAAFSVVVACGGKVRGNEAVSDPDPSAEPAPRPSATASDPAPGPTPTGPPPTADCPLGTSTSYSINDSLCEAQLQSRTTTCDGSTVCSWTIVTPCSLGYVDCNDSCNATRPPGVPAGSSYCRSGFGDDNGRITSTCGSCGR